MTPSSAALGLLFAVAADTGVAVPSPSPPPPAGEGFVDADGDGIDDEAMPPPLPDDDDDALDAGDDARVGETLIGRRRDQKRMVGSAHTVDAEQLERMEADDVHRVLRGVPGVYVRDEDGTGLRPNIGLRGASSDRSAKVTLLEDGVLFGPAPYAAPAAYYFPLTTRITGVEVWKGPAAIRQGPHTIGGAINLRTRAVPLSSTGGLDLGFGLVGPGRKQTRFHGFAGDTMHLGGPLSGWQLGGLVEAARVQSDGFKVIDGQPERPTGFVRDDAMLKLRLMNDITAAVRHSVELKLGLGREEGFETYLGLTDADLRAAPDRRYAASMDDTMRWVRTQGQLRYGLSVGPAEVDVVAYRTISTAPGARSTACAARRTSTTCCRSPTSAQTRCGARGCSRAPSAPTTTAPCSSVPTTARTSLTAWPPWPASTSTCRSSPLMRGAPVGWCSGNSSRWGCGCTRTRSTATTRRPASSSSTTPSSQTACPRSRRR